MELPMRFSSKNLTLLCSAKGKISSTPGFKSATDCKRLFYFFSILEKYARAKLENNVRFVE